MHRAQCSTAVPHSCGSAHRAALCPSCAPRAPVLQPFPPSSRCRAPIPCGVDCRDDVSGFPGLALSPAPAVLRVGLCKLPVLKCTARRCVASCQVRNHPIISSSAVGAALEVAETVGCLLGSAVCCRLVGSDCSGAFRS